MPESSASIPKVHKHIERELEQMMLERKYEPGDNLPSERQLMELFGVGRPAVREALLSLERSGVVRLRSGSPAVVTRVSLDSIMDGLTVPVRSFLNDDTGIRELQQARKLVECAIARRVAEVRTDQDLARMARALDLNRAALGDLPAFERTDMHFHTEIVRTLHNRIFDGIAVAMAGWLLEQRQATLKTPGQPAKALAFHTHIFRAIERGVPAEAEQAMAAHMDQYVEVYWRAASR
jgi:GntR family transcriptional regulator, sialic acid-inducible nan operon repressor